MKRPILTACLMAVALTTPQHSMAHGGATGVVKERMDLMEEMKDAVKEVSAIFKGKTEYSADTIRNAAQTIRNNSGDAITHLFPEGSLSKKSEAKPQIWEEWQRFKQLADRQVKLAEALYKAADNNQSQEHMMSPEGMMGQTSSQHMMGSGAMMGTQSNTPMDDPEHLAQMPASMVFSMVTDNCGACHERYRKEED